MDKIWGKSMQEKIPVRKVDTAQFLSAVKEMIAEGQEVAIMITGGSMTPFLIHERDRILLSKIDRPLRKGDMAFFQRDDGNYVMHRIRSVRPKHGDGEEQYFFIGDAQRVTEGPIRRDQIFAVITAVYRKDRWLYPGDFWWEFFRVIWIRIIPFRGVAARVYRLIRTVFPQ